MNYQNMSVLLRATRVNGLSAQAVSDILSSMNIDDIELPLGAILAEALDSAKRYGTEDHSNYIAAVAAIYFSI